MKHRPQRIYTDDHLIVVNKPANYLSIPDRFDRDKPSVQGFLQQQDGEIFTVHRIDRETSGILVFARDAETHRHLSQQFQDRSVDKQYLALVEGQVLPENGTINKPIGKHPSVAGKMIITKSGKTSVSHYQVVEQFKHFSLLAVKIESGRTHQIRVHLAGIGYPLAIDTLYGQRDAFLLSEIKLKNYRLGKSAEERPLMSRCSLHAHQIQFQHPISGEMMSFTAEPPKDFAAVLKQLRKWGK